jgi:acyl carrier protein
MHKSMIAIDQVYGRLTDVFRDVFEDDDLVPTADMTAEDVDGWTSLAHVRLVLTIEETFGIRFSAAQVSTMANVGDLASTIQKKLS